MFDSLKQIASVMVTVRWLVPRQSVSLRLYLSLLNILIVSRQSVYRHFVEYKAADKRSRVREFFKSVAAIPVSDRPTVTATLLARLLRTIYLTEIAPGDKGGNVARGGPNQGYINHPQFGYGESLQSIIRPKSTKGPLP